MKPLKVFKSYKNVKPSTSRDSQHGGANAERGRANAERGGANGKDQEIVPVNVICPIKNIRLPVTSR